VRNLFVFLHRLPVRVRLGLVPRLLEGLPDIWAPEAETMGDQASNLKRNEHNIIENMVKAIQQDLRSSLTMH
jgi:hypothetical protein